jgi:hypothetical protein
VVAATVFLCGFECNPHCTQRVSFTLAVFQLENHPEDKGWHGPPLVYQASFIWPLRSLLAFVVMTGLFTPALVTLAARSGLLGLRLGLIVQGCASLLPGLLSLFPREVIGERFQVLLRAASLYSVAAILVVLLVMARIESWRCRRNFNPVADLCRLMRH